MTTKMLAHVNRQLSFGRQPMRANIADERPELVFVSSVALAVHCQRIFVHKILPTNETDEVTGVRLDVLLKLLEELKLAAAKPTGSQNDFAIAMNLRPVFVLPVLRVELLLAYLAAHFPGSPLFALVNDLFMTVEDLRRFADLLANVARDFLRRRFLFLGLVGVNVVDMLVEFIARSEAFLAAIGFTFKVSSILMNSSYVPLHRPLEGKSSLADRALEHRRVVVDAHHVHLQVLCFFEYFLTNQAGSVHFVADIVVVDHVLLHVVRSAEFHRTGTAAVVFDVFVNAWNERFIIE